MTSTTEWLPTSQAYASRESLLGTPALTLQDPSFFSVPWGGPAVPLPL